MHEPVRPDDAVETAGLDVVISLRPHLEAIWRYRRIILAAVVVVSLVFFAGVFALIARAPVERTASIQFRLEFEGAIHNKYPNDTPFSPTDIVAPPVAAEVFKTNDLQRFGPYEDFKESLFVQRSSLALDLLSYEYQTKLADSRLSPVDRSKLEAEFESKRESLQDPSYAVSFSRRERFTTMPPALIEKVLNDTLATWAKQAEQRRGVLTYNIAQISGRILSREDLQASDYLVAVDGLRAKAVRIIRTIDELQKVPGALSFRMTKGGLSLTEIRARLEDVIRLDLEPLIALIRAEGVSKNPRELALYASNMAFRLQLDKREAEDRARALQTSLREYLSQGGSGLAAGGSVGTPPARSGIESGGVIPQLSESFLDRLQQMSVMSKPGEMEYRRKLTDQLIAETRQVATVDRELGFYTELARTVQAARGSAPAATVSEVTARTMKAFDVIDASATDLTQFTQELSTQNLNPAARLFTVTGPFTLHAERSISVQRLVVTYVFLLLVTLIVAPAACLAHNLMRRRPAVTPEREPSRV